MVSTAKDASSFQKKDPQIPYDQEGRIVGVGNLKTRLKIDTSTWLTRNQSADLLKVSVNTIANLERKGKLKPQKVYRADARGIEHCVAVYDPREVAALPHGSGKPTVLSEGELAARCFELFDLGQSVREVVITVRETAERVHKIRESWLDAGGADLVINPTAYEAFVQRVGKFKDISELLQLFDQAIAGKEPTKQ